MASEETSPRPISALLRRYLSRVQWPRRSWCRCRRRRGLVQEGRCGRLTVIARRSIMKSTHWLLVGAAGSLVYLTIADVARLTIACLASRPPDPLMVKAKFRQNLTKMSSSWGEPDWLCALGGKDGCRPELG